MKGIYKKGSRKEYKVCNDLRNKENFEIVQRTAGSHSKIDIIAIDPITKRIKLIQCKRTLKENMDYIDPRLKKDIEEENLDLNGVFHVKFEVR